MSRETRPYLDKEHPDVYRAMLDAVAASRQACRDAGITDQVRELVNVRVSQLNACSTCLSMHTPAARKAGVAQAKLDVLPSWRYVPLFTPVEKAALALSESLTVLDAAEDRDALADRVAQQLNRAQISAVEWVVTLINAFNRISIASGHPVLVERD